jgi:hypothetical protein
MERQIMRFNIAPRVKVDPGQWHAWFAWYPVEVSAGKWIWLENVVRKRCYITRSPPAAMMVSPVTGYWKYKDF